MVVEMGWMRRGPLGLGLGDLEREKEKRSSWLARSPERGHTHTFAFPPVAFQRIPKGEGWC